MRIITLPSHLYKETIDRKTDEQLWDIYLAISKTTNCPMYANEKDFQEAFNNGYISDEWFIYFIK